MLDRKVTLGNISEKAFERQKAQMEAAFAQMHAGLQARMKEMAENIGRMSESIFARLKADAERRGRVRYGFPEFEAPPAGVRYSGNPTRPVVTIRPFVPGEGDRHDN